MAEENEILDFVNSSEFKEFLGKAADLKFNAVSQLVPEMKSYREEFIDFMLGGAVITDKDERKEYARKFGKIFKTLVDFVHYSDGVPNENSVGKLEKLAQNVEIAVKFFDFIGDTTFRDKLAARGIYIDDVKSKKLTDDYPHVNVAAAENLGSIIDSGDECHGQIRDTDEKIKNELYDELIPEEYRYSNENKIGIKRSVFSKLTNVLTNVTRKKEEKQQEYIDNLREASLFNITSEEILQKGYSQVEESIKD